MPRIYCDICGAQFRKGKTFHEHLKKSKCTRVSALISVLQSQSDVEVSNPESEKSIKQEAVHELKRTDTAGVTDSGEASNQGNEPTDAYPDLENGISVKQEKDESEFYKSTNSQKTESVDSESESSLSDTGFEEVEVTPNGDILIFSSDNDESDFSDEVDWDYLESTGKVETFRQNGELQAEADSTSDEPSKIAKKPGETLTKRKKERQSKPNFKHSDRSAKKQCLQLERQKTKSVNLGRPATRSVQLGRPATRSVQIGRKDSQFKELSTHFIGTRKSTSGRKFSAQTVDTECRQGRKANSYTKENKNDKINNVSRNKLKTKTAKKRKRNESNSGYDESDDEMGKDKVRGKLMTSNLKKRVKKSADPKQKNGRNKNFYNNTLTTRLQNTQKACHMKNTDTESRLKEKEQNHRSLSLNSGKNISDKRGQEFINKRKSQIRCDVNKSTRAHTKNSANINTTPQRGKNDKHVVSSMNRNMENHRIQMTSSDNNASESDFKTDSETHTAKNQEVTIKKNKRNVYIESESSTDEESSTDIAISSKGNKTDEDEDIENDDADTEFFIESDSCSDTDSDKQVTRSKSMSDIPLTTETGQESTVALDSFNNVNDHRTDCELINQTEQSEDCGKPEEGVELQSFVCGICHQSFSDSESLEAHIFTHCDNSSPVVQSPSEFICGICSTVYNCNEDLENHIVEHMDKSDDTDMNEPKKQNVSERKKQKSLHTLKCGKCKQEFPSAKSLHRHLMTHFSLYESIDDTEIVHIEKNVNDNLDMDKTENMCSETGNSETGNEVTDTQDENGKYANDKTNIETNTERAEKCFGYMINDVIDGETSEEIAVESIEKINDDKELKKKESKESSQLVGEEKTVNKVADSSYSVLKELLKQNDEVGIKKTDNQVSDSLGTTPSKSITQSFVDGSIIDLTKMDDDDMLKGKESKSKERNQLLSEEKKGKKASNSVCSLLKGLLKRNDKVGTKKPGNQQQAALGVTGSRSATGSSIDGSIIDLTKTPSSPDVSDVALVINGTSGNILDKDSSVEQQRQEVHSKKESEKDTSTAIPFDSNKDIASNKSVTALDTNSSLKSKIVVQTQNQLMIPVAIPGKSDKLQKDSPVLLPLNIPIEKHIQQNVSSMLIPAEIPGIPRRFSTDSPIIIPVTFQGNLDKLKTDKPMVIPLKITGDKAKAHGKDDILIPVNLQTNEGKLVRQWSGCSKMKPGKIKKGNSLSVTSQREQVPVTMQTGQVPIPDQTGQVPVTLQSRQVPVTCQFGQKPVTSQSEQVPVTIQSGQVQVTCQSGQVPVASQSGQVPVAGQSGQVPPASPCGQVPVTVQNGQVLVTSQGGQVPPANQSGSVPVTVQSGQVPLTCQSGQVPVTSQTGKVQVTSQSGEAPDTVQTGQVPVTSQTGQVPPASQSRQVPVTMQTGQVPVTVQSGQVPLTCQSGQMPVTSQTGQVPHTVQNGQVPVTMQTAQVQVTSQSGEAPDTVQTGQVPVTSQTGQVPPASQSRQVPVTMQTGQVPVTVQSGQVPLTCQSGQMPVTSQTGQVPVTVQNGQVPVTMQTAQVQVTSQSGEAPDTVQTGQVPVTSQTGQVPPASQSRQVPVTMQTGQVPVTVQSGQVPLTCQSGQMPVTSQTGQVPVTVQNGQVPVTMQTAQVQVTSQSGKVPDTVQTGQVLGTSKSGQVPVTSQSGQVQITSQTGQVPVTSQSGHVPDTEQSEQVPITSQFAQVPVTIQIELVPITSQIGHIPATMQCSQMLITSQSEQENLTTNKLGPVTERTVDNSEKLALVSSETLSDHKKGNTPKVTHDQQTVSSSGQEEKQKQDSRELIINKLMNYKPKFFMD